MQDLLAIIKLLGTYIWAMFGELESFAGNRRLRGRGRHDESKAQARCDETSEVTHETRLLSELYPEYIIFSARVLNRVALSLDLILECDQRRNNGSLIPDRSSASRFRNVP